MAYQTAAAFPVSTGDTGPFQAARQGDASAYNGLMIKHQEAAYNLAWQLVGDDGLAEQAVQAAAAELWRSLPLGCERSFRLELLRRTAAACRRARPARRENRLLTRGGWASLRDLLPAQLRAPLYLVDGEGLAYAEAAWVLGENLETIRSRVAMGRVRAVRAG